MIADERHYRELLQERERWQAMLRRRAGMGDMMVYAAILHELERCDAALRQYEARERVPVTR